MTTRMNGMDMDINLFWIPFTQFEVDHVTKILQLAMEMSECYDEPMSHIVVDHNSDICLVVVYDNGHLPSDITDQVEDDFKDCLKEADKIEYLESLGYSVEVLTVF